VYAAHFGLKGRPFAETVSPAAYVPAPSRDAVLRRLRYALEHGDGPAVLYGPAGSGKTLLARRLAGEIRARAVHVAFPALPVADLVAWLAGEFGEPAAPAGSLHRALRILRDNWAALAASGERPLLILDDAHLIRNTETFEALRMLLNFSTEGLSDLSMLLVGTAEVLLELPSGLADRLAARCLLAPLTAEETFAYVVGRLATAGGTSPLFTPEALSLMHRAALGLPRRLNRLADLALLIAYAQELTTVGEATVELAAHELVETLSAA
jgi:type II secretory pathway predicted ATPase ExeA